MPSPPTGVWLVWRYCSGYVCWAIGLLPWAEIVAWILIIAWDRLIVLIIAWDRLIVLIIAWDRLIVLIIAWDRLIVLIIAWDRLIVLIIAWDAHQLSLLQRCPYVGVSTLVGQLCQ